MVWCFDLFVVYAAADADFVRGYLVPALNLSPQRVLLVEELTPGAYFVSEIARGVTRSRFTVAVLSPAYLEDRWAVFGEQLASYVSVEDARVIPLRRMDCELPLQLQARVSLDFTEPASWEPQTTRLRQLLQTAAPAPLKLPCPYPGMRPFAIEDASRFFGRDKELDDLVGRLDRGEREIYVVGPSGSGKSSLVQAGLLHTLDTGSSRLERSFVVRSMRPGARPVDRLAKALEGDLATPAATLGALLARHPPAKSILVFVDQFEELFTLTDVVERRRFLATLRTLRQEERCCLLLALRADFFGELMDSELWADLAGSMSPLAVAPLRGTALAKAITAPATRAGVYLEARLCDQLVVDAANEPGALPHVQETLRMLWDKRRHQLLGLAEYEALGDGGPGLHIAIAQRADATMRELTTAQQTIARRVLLRLVSFGEGRPDTRRQQEVQALRSAADEAEFSHVLQRLVADRLITIDGAEWGNSALADLSHEALITAWPEFQTWIAQRRLDEQRRRRLEAKVLEWIERGRGAASLLDPVELSEAEQWMQSDAGRELGYGAELPALVAASRGAIEKARRVVGMSYLEQGRALLFDGHPMQALPYFVAARTEMVESPVLRMLFAQASSSLPLVSFVGHRSAVSSAAFSPDGTRVITASRDNTARIWDVSSGMPVTLPLQHHDIVSAAAFSPDGKRVVTASFDKTARVWDASTGRPMTPPLKHQDVVEMVAFSPSGTHVVTASFDHTARVWDALTGRSMPQLLGHRGSVYGAAFSPDGTRVVTASHDKTARIWDASTGRPVTSPLEHQDLVQMAAFSPDGTRVVTASGDHTARVWDASMGAAVTMPLKHRGVVHAAAFSPDRTRVVTASDDKTARIWDASTGKLVTPPLEHRSTVWMAAFSRDGTCIVTASSDHTARVWDASTGRPVTPPLEHQSFVHTAAFSPDGTRVVTASRDMTARVWSATTGIPVSRHQDSVFGATFSPDGTRVVTASCDKTARVWEVSTGTPATPPLEHQSVVYTAAFSPDGTRVVTASADDTARVWDVSTGRPVTPPLAHQAAVYAAGFSPDGTRVVTASWDDTARVWDASTGRPVTAPLLHQGAVWAAAFSPDGTQIVTASRDKTARVWDAATGAPVTRPLEHQGEVYSAGFSPDGTRVVTASSGRARARKTSNQALVNLPLLRRDMGTLTRGGLGGTRVAAASFGRTARVWDIATGTPVTPPLEHQGSVYAAVFSPGGTHLVTASQDGTARVWAASTGRPVTPPLEHQGAVNTAAFSPDGTRVVTASDDKTARVWDVSTGTPVTPPLEHQGFVRMAAFSPDGTRVITASSDNTARIWTIPIDIGSLEDWRLLARCSPFALVNGILKSNADPLRVCPRPVHGGAGHCAAVMASKWAATVVLDIEGAHHADVATDWARIEPRLTARDVEVRRALLGDIRADAVERAATVVSREVAPINRKDSGRYRSRGTRRGRRRSCGSARLR